MKGGNIGCVGLSAKAYGRMQQKGGWYCLYLYRLKAVSAPSRTRLNHLKVKSDKVFAYMSRLIQHNSNSPGDCNHSEIKQIEFFVS